MKQIEDKQPEQVKEPILPVPLRIVRWAAYSLLFFFLLVPFVTGSGDAEIKSFLKAFCGGLILGHFASQLNVLIKK
jgi:hypothetical protein